MKLKKLKLENFRLFSDFELTLPDSNPIVIIGNNGAGKTTLLDAIAISFTHFTGFLLSKTEVFNIDSWFETKDVKKGSKNGLISIEFDFKMTERLKSWENKDVTKTISISKNINEPGHKYEIIPKDFLKETKILLNENKLSSIPIIAYYNVNRTYQGNKADKPKAETYNKKIFAYEQSLNIHLPNFANFETWFIKQEQLENASKVEKQDLNFELPALKIVKKAFKLFANKIEPNTFLGISVKRESTVKADFSEEIKEFLSISKLDNTLNFNQLSSGERMVIELVCEIARRLTIANDNSDDSLERPGIVLIDEIELHIHPIWQKNIIKALRETFPNIQFIITTHSPLVLSGVRRENIIVLHNGNVIPSDELPDIFGGTADEILKKLQFADNSISDFDNEKREIDILFNSLKFDEAETKLNQLKEKVKSNPQWLEDYELSISFAKT